MNTYPHPAHRENDRGRILEFIDRTTLGTVITFVDGEFLNTNLSCTLLVHGECAVLEAHVPRSNPQTQRKLAPAMVMFQGPQAYIWPGWYATKRRTGRGVPTWDYLVAKAHGTLEVVDDPTFVLDQVTRLTAAQEGRLHDPWSPSDAPKDYIDGMVSLLVGIRIVVARLEAVWKLSWNQPPRIAKASLRAYATKGATTPDRLRTKSSATAAEQAWHPGCPVAAGGHEMTSPSDLPAAVIDVTIVTCFR